MEFQPAQKSHAQSSTQPSDLITATSKDLSKVTTPEERVERCMNKILSDFFASDTEIFTISELKNRCPNYSDNGFYGTAKRILFEIQHCGFPYLTFDKVISTYDDNTGRYREFKYFAFRKDGNTMELFKIKDGFLQRESRPSDFMWFDRIPDLELSDFKNIAY